MPENCIVIDWGTQKFFYFAVEVFGRKAYIMRPERNPFPNDVVEIIGTEHICSNHGLTYGDIASFVITYGK
jgi:CTP-dependent riboflavin kinase